MAKFGTPEQQERWLAPAIRGEKIAALAITEPDAGSDVAGARTRAVKVDGGWLVNGSKTYITNGVRADFYVTAVRTRDEAGHGSMSFLVIEKGEGVTATQAGEARLARVRHGRDRVRRRVRRPTSTCSARRAAAST